MHFPVVGYPPHGSALQALVAESQPKAQGVSFSFVKQLSYVHSPVPQQNVYLDGVHDVQNVALSAQQSPALEHMSSH